VPFAVRREKGEAIAIGHPHPGHLQALRIMLRRSSPRGAARLRLRLVPLRAWLQCDAG